jgi:hypothetical protein
MPKKTARGQRAIQRKTARHEEKKRALARVEVQVHRSVSTSDLRPAAKWPVLECLVSDGWNEPGDVPMLTNVVVARQSPRDTVAAAVFLVDLACLGVKNAMGRTFGSRAEYQEEILDRFPSPHRWKKIDLNLAAKIIREGIAYAQELGFKPHRDYHRMAVLLEGARPDESSVEVPVGFKGKPLFVSGPFDNAKAIMAKLERKLGTGNYDYVVKIPAGPTEIFDELEEDEA